VDNIKEIVHQVVGDIAKKSVSRAKTVEDVWVRALEIEEMKHVRLDGEKEGCLFACVDSPAWMYQMSLRKKKILDFIQKDIPGVKKISFKIGKVT
jgi:hypothetical protein